MKTTVDIRYNRGALFYIPGTLILVFSLFALFGSIHGGDPDGLSILPFFLGSTLLVLGGNRISYKDTFSIQNGRIKQNRQYRSFGNQESAYHVGSVREVFYRIDRESGMLYHLKIFLRFNNKNLLICREYMDIEEYFKCERDATPKAVLNIKRELGFSNVRKEKGRPLFSLRAPLDFLEDLKSEI